MFIDGWRYLHCFFDGLECKRSNLWLTLFSRLIGKVRDWVANCNELAVGLTFLPLDGTCACLRSLCYWAIVSSGLVAENVLDRVMLCFPGWQLGVVGLRGCSCSSRFNDFEWLIFYDRGNLQTRGCLIRQHYQYFLFFWLCSTQWDESISTRDRRGSSVNPSCLQMAVGDKR